MEPSKAIETLNTTAFLTWPQAFVIVAAIAAAAWIVVRLIRVFDS